MMAAHLCAEAALRLVKPGNQVAIEAFPAFTEVVLGWSRKLLG